MYQSKGDATVDNIIVAYLMAYDDGVDIIACSLGSVGQIGIVALVVQRIVVRGVTVITTAGNMGDEGLYSY